jgi:hypothetical protein
MYDVISTIGGTILFLAIVAGCVKLVMMLRSRRAPVDIPRGPVRTKIYTYDGRPLAGFAVGEPFKLTVIRGESSMESVYTGTVCRGEGCVDYGARPIGFIADYRKQYAPIVALARRHRRVTLWASIEGYDDAMGYPLVVAELPRDEWFATAR